MIEKINFAWPVTSEHATVYHYFVSKIDKIRDSLERKRVVIFGAGIRGCSLMQILEKQGVKNIVFCDNNPKKQGHLINEYDIISLEKAIMFSGEQMFLISPESADSIKSQLEAAGLYENKDYFSFSISAYDAYVEEYLRPIADYLLVMGDCAFTHIALTDTITESLGDMIKSQFGENRCKVLGMHGMGHQAYYHIVKSLLERGERPSSLLLLAVLETLTPKAHLMPRTQHPELICRLTKSIENPNDNFLEYAELAKERFGRLQVESFAFSGSQQTESSEKLYMKMNYLFKIREHTEGVIYMKKTIQMLNDKDIPVTLYIPPVNYTQGEKFFGQEFNSIYEENFTKLFKFLDGEGLKYSVANASFLLTEEEFAASNTIDETSNYAGRCKLLKFLTLNGNLI